MLTSGKHIDLIIESLSKLKQEIDSRAKQGFTNLNKQCESFFCHILNMVYNYNLKNLNDENINYPGIDLGDQEKKIAYQVTSKIKSEKIDHTLETFINHRHYVVFKVLKILILGTKQPTYTIKTQTNQFFSFDLSKDIVDLEDLYNSMQNLDPFKLEPIFNYVQAEIYGVRQSLTPDGILNEYRIHTEQYCNWVEKTMNSFTIAGLNISLPISKAWIQLRLLEDKHNDINRGQDNLEKSIARYHEWERLAISSNSESIFNVDAIAEDNIRCIIIGGPGSGKSTLLKKLANYYAQDNKIVLRVRLQQVSIQVNKNGVSFENALIIAASDGSGINPTILLAMLSSPHYLLADGLDECDPNRGQVCEQLIAWGDGHPNSKIIVTTRPVGHNPSIFTNWSHYEIMPLNKSEALEFSNIVLSIHHDRYPEKVASEYRKINKLLDDNRTASLASRNPLLLGFIIALSIKKFEIGRRRYSLYEQIVNQIQTQQISDRFISTDLSDAHALEFLNIFGWILLNNPAISKNEFVGQAAKLYNESSGMEMYKANEEAEKAIKYWEDRRLLEKVSWGLSRDIYFRAFINC